MDSQSLAEVLSGLGSMSLLGLALLESHSPDSGEWFPRHLPPDEVIAATVEFIQYGERVQTVARRLESLHSVVLTLPCLEYGI